jgi:hypothetical protein
MVRQGRALRVAALLLALLVAGVLVHLFLRRETTGEKIRGPAVVKGCDVRGSRVNVTAEVYNDRDHAMNLIFWATHASGTSVTKPGAGLPSVHLEPGQRMTRTATAEIMEGVDQGRATGCEVSVR